VTTPGPSRERQILARVAPASLAQRRSAARVCATHALTQPDPVSTLQELLGALGLNEKRHR